MNAMGKKLLAMLVAMALVMTMSPAIAFGEDITSGKASSPETSQADAAKTKPKPKPKYKHAQWIRFLGKAKNSKGGIAVSNGKISAKNKKLLKKRTIKNAACGYIALNVKTGKVVAHNANMRIFSASSIKAPYIAALCKYGAPGLKSRKSQMRSVITYSDNAKYNALYYRYGKSYLNRFARESGVKLNLHYATCYADYTPRELAKLWATIKDYLSNGKRNVKMFKKLFGQGSYYKEGWMYNGTWCGQMYHVGGVKGNCVYAIMTRTARPNKAVWNLRNALVKALA